MQKNHYVDIAVRYIEMKQGVLGIKVKIMLPHDPKGIVGPSKGLPDVVSFIEPKEELTSSSTKTAPHAQNFLPIAANNTNAAETNTATTTEQSS